MITKVKAKFNEGLPHIESKIIGAVLHEKENNQLF
jgi:hypothetical protein